MTRSLTAQFFFAFVASSMFIIAMLAAAVIWSMHDGFARYLLHEELGMFAGMAETLGQRYDPENPHWPDLTSDPNAWQDFVAEHYAHPKIEENDTGLGETVGGPPSLEAKLFLLNQDGAEIIAPQIRGDVVETLPILLPGQKEAPVGWVGLSSVADV
ncbi:hypothetical protein [Ruegeria sp. ANG-R]|uniref:hypothetical protein n=1 Tax=Ruegeria sp. ANG-R TaxID=1577903 RepID=UPI00126A5493|nr:hypothetical protein [Ruegeria sp. ANG-R]